MAVRSNFVGKGASKDRAVNAAHASMRREEPEARPVMPAMPAADAPDELAVEQLEARLRAKRAQFKQRRLNAKAAGKRRAHGLAVDERVDAERAQARRALAELNAKIAWHKPPAAEPSWRCDVATCVPILYTEGPKAGQQIMMPCELPDGTKAMAKLWRRELVLSYGRHDGPGRHTARWGQIHKKGWLGGMRADIVGKVGEAEAARIEAVMFPNGAQMSNGTKKAPKPAESTAEKIARLKRELAELD